MLPLLNTSSKNSCAWSFDRISSKQGTFLLERHVLDSNFLLPISWDERFPLTLTLCVFLLDGINGMYICVSFVLISLGFKYCLRAQKILYSDNDSDNNTTHDYIYIYGISQYKHQIIENENHKRKRTTKEQKYKIQNEKRKAKTEPTRKCIDKQRNNNYSTSCNYLVVFVFLLSYLAKVLDARFICFWKKICILERFLSFFFLVASFYSSFFFLYCTLKTILFAWRCCLFLTFFEMVHRKGTSSLRAVCWARTFHSFCWPNGIVNLMKNKKLEHIYFKRSRE